ncbi:Hypothetical protein GLP15_2898 [Giardia lamblia P15]|uniref:Schlafen AlbA-2 domain-containing protein n=1 Tax=Giardia intestinalis (strain P15) TaxID=658858 RepID=E1EZM5_GIAIA|nr:Hypothetical protein GLP15_2898 [Giardia lamblia P15]
MTFGEDAEIEFEELGKTNDLISEIEEPCRQHLNGFVNSRGGTIFFGIKDTREVKGLVISASDQDLICRLVSKIVGYMIPPVDANMSEMTFIPVLKDSDPSSSVGSHADSQPNSKEREISRYVIMISILPGDDPIYFTTSASQAMYVRRGPYTVEMSTDEAIRRINLGRSIVKSHDPPKFRHISRISSPEIFNCRLEYLDTRHVTQKDLLFSAVNFLTAKRIATKTSCIKVIMFYGSSLTRTIQVDKELCNLITTDKEKFPTTYKGYYIDLKGSTTEPVSLRDALFALLRLIASSIDQAASVATRSPPAHGSTDGATISPSDRNGEAAGTSEEAVDSTLSNNCRSLPCACPSTRQDQTPPRDAHLVPGSDATELPELKKYILSLLPQTPFFEALSENLVSKVAVEILRIAYMDLLHEINSRGETVLLHLKDVGDKAMLDGLLPTGVQSVAVVTYGLQPGPFEPHPEYKLLYVLPSLVQTG